MLLCVFNKITEITKTTTVLPHFTERKLMNHSRHRMSGFTLIEVMVGVAIFAVLAALVVSSIKTNGDRNAKLEAQRFVAVVNEVRDEAVISGKTFAMQVNEKGRSYGFSIVGADQQASASLADTLIRDRQLHESVKLKWDVFENFNDDDDEQGSDNNDPAVDQVFITGLGEITPFEVRFGGEDVDFLVALNEEGVLQIDTKTANFF